MDCFGRELSDTRSRVEVLEEVGAEHSTAHKAAAVRMGVLEKEMQQLHRQVIAQQRENPGGHGRSMTPCRGSNSSHDRSPAPSTKSPRDLEGELQLVVVGWKEARRADAEQEVRAAFEQGGFQESILDLWAPYVRTTFIKVTQRFPERGAPFTIKRAFQTRVLQGIKTLKLVSRVAGSEGRELYC